MWFEDLVGFAEQDPRQVRERLTVEEEMLVSSVSGTRIRCGRLEIPSLAELRLQIAQGSTETGKLRLSEVVADVQDLHRDPANAGATFQVASQFNLLEMVSPSVTPEEGVGIYEMDRTQGPACAIACGAGTIYRNYFVPVGDQIGQTHDQQIDCLADMGRQLGNENDRLWTMRNGYALASEAGLCEISDRLTNTDETQRDRLRGLLRIGIQSNAQVTLGNASHVVSQVYGSALPVTYSPHAASLWEPWARLILEASYEATLCAAILNAQRTGNNRLYLTLLGGGAFGNDARWIASAIDRAMDQHSNRNLDVFIVKRGAAKH